MTIEVISNNIDKIETEAIIINSFEGTKKLEHDTASIDSLLDGLISRLIAEHKIKGKLNEIIYLHSLGKLPASWIIVTGLGKRDELTPDKIRKAVAETCRMLRQKRILKIATCLQGVGVNGITPNQAAQVLTEGYLLGTYTFRKYITDDDEYEDIKQFAIVDPNSKLLPALSQGTKKGKILANATILARDMINEPANFMTPTHIAETASRIASELNLEIKVLDKAKMQELSMGGLLGVAQGSQQPPKLIVIKYYGGNSDTPDIALVGKGITFDSGGISIKPSERMEEMKGDMAGGAAVLAAISAIAQLKPSLNVVSIIPATENLPSGSALKPGDLLRAMNGKTIEVQNTDAEGRLVLSDALAYANNLGAKYIIDVATLTGACIVALGKITTGAFSNNQDLVDSVIGAGKEAGEPIWQLPMYDDYREQLKSDVADIKNVGGREAGAITGAKFLSEFVGTTPWVHLDIAGTSLSTKEQGYLTKGAAGVMVRTLINLVLSMDQS